MPISTYATLKPAMQELVQSFGITHWQFPKKRFAKSGNDHTPRLALWDAAAHHIVELPLLDRGCEGLVAELPVSLCQGQLRVGLTTAFGIEQQRITSDTRLGPLASR
jgi:hypothetical protein